MKHLLPVAALAALLVAGCTGRQAAKDANEIETLEEENAQTSVLGPWNIEKISLADTLVLVPTEVDSDLTCSIIFLPDSTFGASTNCNSVGGTYTVSGKTIKFDHLATTQMFCPDTRLEGALGTALPAITTTDYVNDSTLVLRSSDPALYIELSRSTVLEDEADI